MKMRIVIVEAVSRHYIGFVANIFIHVQSLFGDGKLATLLDAEKMKFPLTIRARRPGDYFYPMGFGRKKKLQDLLVDLKIARDERDCIPIIVSGDDIDWVAGYRADERCKVTETTKKCVRLGIVQGKF